MAPTIPVNATEPITVEGANATNIAAPRPIAAVVASAVTPTINDAYVAGANVIAEIPKPKTPTPKAGETII
ncbi:hypothetical protein JWG45_15925 [Leptospira sp. 201903070]|uniref:Uncharacterized protein n=1 Tax=Leptospira ainlahdjerensis TaxID=2810033 RepID=A0ABS2UEQ2_9LEPT|nr:hypothetical protein [Leptospira ainlahdjerensis]MBM9578634.1 hypothetical protein [Leptospira ainlahdjerensis]